MIVRIYQYDGCASRSTLYAKCIAKLDLTPDEINQADLLDTYNGDFFTLDEMETTDGREPQLLR